MSLHSASEFRDRHERRTYLRAVEIARRIVENPGLIEHGRQFLNRHVRNDPRQAKAFKAWDQVLCLPAAEVAALLTADNEDGRYLRETAPVFTILTPIERKIG